MTATTMEISVTKETKLSNGQALKKIANFVDQQKQRKKNELNKDTFMMDVSAVEMNDVLIY